MTIPQFIDRLRPLAVEHDWIILGDGSICVRNRVNGHPINIVAQTMNPTFDDAAWMQDEMGEIARSILGMGSREYDRLGDAIVGQCSRYNGVRLLLLVTLDLKEDF